MCDVTGGANAKALLRRIGPAFLAAFTFRGVRAVAPLLDAAEALKAFYASDRRRFPADLPRGFVRPGWRAAVFRDNAIDPQSFELCFFAKLRGRLRAGNVWVEGGRQYRAVEDQLIARPVFAAMKQAGPLPVAVPLDVSDWLVERRAVLDRRLAEVEARVSVGALPDVRIADCAIRIAPLEAAVPEPSLPTHHARLARNSIHRWKHAKACRDRGFRKRPHDAATMTARQPDRVANTLRRPGHEA